MYSMHVLQLETSNPRIPGPVVLCRRIGNGVSLFMSSERSLQLLYDQLFGADDRDEDGTSLVTSNALQADLHMCAAERPVVLDRPAGLHLFRAFVSQQEQVRMLALFLSFLSTLPSLCDHDVGSSPGMHQQAWLAERRSQPGNVVWGIAFVGTRAC